MYSGCRYISYYSSTNFVNLIMQSIKHQIVDRQAESGSNFREHLHETKFL